MWKVFKDCKQTISGLVSKLFPHRMSFWHSCLEYGISMCKPNLNKFRLIFFLSPGLLVSGWRRRRCRSSVAGQGLLHKLCLYSSNSWGVMRNNFSLGNHAQKNGKNNLECWWWCTGRTSLSILALGKDQLKGRIWILKAWGLVVVMDQTPWWGSLYVVPVNAEKISLNVASSHQVTQLLLVPRNNLLIGFCTGFTVKTQVEWEFMKVRGKLSSCSWQNRLWMHQGKHILSSLDPSTFAAWWLCSPVALWWAQDGSVSTFP